jgi:hypothetical protein
MMDFGPLYFGTIGFGFGPPSPPSFYGYGFGTIAFGFGPPSPPSCFGEGFGFGTIAFGFGPPSPPSCFGEGFGLLLTFLITQLESLSDGVVSSKDFGFFSMIGFGPPSFFGYG